VYFNYYNRSKVDNQGWVKLHRKILDNPISEKPNYAWLWCTLLLLANHTEHSFIWNNQKQTVRSGQLVTGIKALSKKTGIPQGTVYRILKYLENEKQIEQRKTTRFSLITIVNWDMYQENEKQNEKQMKNGLKTNEKRIETYKNDKNEKNEKNNTTQKNSQNPTPEGVLGFYKKHTGQTKGTNRATKAYGMLIEKVRGLLDEYGLEVYKWIRQSVTDGDIVTAQRFFLDKRWEYYAEKEVIKEKVEENKEGDYDGMQALFSPELKAHYMRTSLHVNQGKNENN
jgi:hypothetical protein